MIKYADIIEIEMAIRSIMKPKGHLVIIQPSNDKNTPYDHPVRITINSNTFYVDREDLAPLQDPYQLFDLYDVFMDFVRTATKDK